MTSNIGKCLLKIGEQLNAPFLNQLSQNLFKNHNSNVITMINRTISGAKINMPSFDASDSTIKFIPLKNCVNQGSIFQSAFRRIHDFREAMPSLYMSSNIGHIGRSLQRKFGSSSVLNHNKPMTTNNNNNLSKHFTAKYDFPIYPVPTPPKPLDEQKSSFRPIAQNYMPLEPIYDTKSSEKLYRNLGNSHKSLLPDFTYSFPCSLKITYPDVERPEKSILPQLENRKTQENSLHLIIGKLSSTPTSKNNFWSIGDNFSFPSISTRFGTETFVTPVNDETQQNPTNES